MGRANAADGGYWSAAVNRKKQQATFIGIGRGGNIGRFAAGAEPCPSVVQGFGCFDCCTNQRGRHRTGSDLRDGRDEAGALADRGKKHQTERPVPLRQRMGRRCVRARARVCDLYF